VGARASLVLELKGALVGSSYVSAVPVASAILGLIQGSERVVVSSFEPEAVAAMRSLAPSVATAITSYHGVDPAWALQVAKDAGHVECHVPRDSISSAFVASAHAAAIKVLCWTVNEPDDVASMLAADVDGVFTDDPARARRVLSGDHA